MENKGGRLHLQIIHICLSFTDTHCWHLFTEATHADFKQSNECFSTHMLSCHVILSSNSSTVAGDSQPAGYLIGLKQRCKHLIGHCYFLLYYMLLSSVYSCLTANEKKFQFSHNMKETIKTKYSRTSLKLKTVLKKNFICKFS